MPKNARAFVPGAGLHGHVSPRRPAIVDFVQWAHHNHALLFRRARQGPRRRSRFAARGTAAANLLGCLRQLQSTDERRYYELLRSLIVQRRRAPSSEETRLLSEVWSSVSSALRAELGGTDATPPVTPGAGVPVPGRGVAGFVQWAHRNRALLLRRAWEGPSRHSRLPAKGTTAAYLLGCLRSRHSTDERRYYNMLYRIIVGRYRPLSKEEMRQLDGVCSSVSPALHAELEDADATPPATPGAGASVPGAGRELGDHAAALWATAPAASIPGRATPRKARASVPGMGLCGHTPRRSARQLEVMLARCGKKRRTAREL